LCAVGCARRTSPYHFRAPLLTSVNASEIHATSRPRLAIREMPHRPLPGPGLDSAPPVRVTIPSKPLASGDGNTLADELRGLVGKRLDTTSDVEIALHAITQIGAVLDRDLMSVTTGRALVALAKQRGALDQTDQPLLGDLVVFNRVEGSRAASLVGVVVSANSHGTVEFIYLARGIVRRGFVNPTHPRTKRDGAGRALNTFVRHSDGRDPRGTQYLAGRLWYGYVRLDQLLR
jgi:hypothetical protein